MTENQPPGIGLDGRTTISDLDQLPGKSWCKQRLSHIPEVNVVRIHDIDTLVVLSGEHCIETIYLSGENSHPLILSHGPVQGDESKTKEVRGFNQFRHHHSAVPGSESRVIDIRTVVIMETHEAGIFDSIPL